MNLWSKLLIISWILFLKLSHASNYTSWCSSFPVVWSKRPNIASVEFGSQQGLHDSLGRDREGHLRRFYMGRTGYNGGRSYDLGLEDDPLGKVVFLRKFAKKHLQMSQICQRHHHLLLSTRSQSGEPLWHSPIPSFFNNLSNSTITLIQLNCPIYGNYLEIFSCDGILCLTSNADFAVLWNPSIRRFNRLPPLETHWENNSYSFEEVRCLYSFGYDHANDVYKVVTAQKK